jgi:YVTN family beta-propeller protein
MRLRQLFPVVPLFFVMAFLGQAAFTTNCYAEAFAYIPNSGDNTLSVVKVLDNTVSGPITLGGSPFGVAANPSDQDYVYITNSSDNTVSVISVSYNSVVKSLAVGATPKGIDITSDGSCIYVANSAADSVSAIDITSDISETIGVGNGPLGVALAPKQDYLYVTNNEDDSLSIIKAETNKLFVTLKNNYYIKYNNSTDDIAFSSPYGVAVSPDSYYIYVVNNGNNTVSKLSATIVYSAGTDFDFADYDATDSTSGPYTLYEPITVGNDPRGVAVTPDQAYLYVTNYGDNTVSVINLSTWAVVKTITEADGIGEGPFGVSVNPSGDFAYVVNEKSGTVSVIYTYHGDDGVHEDFEVIETVTLGDSPVGFGNFIGGKAPRAPSSLTATLGAKNAITITWNDNSSDEVGFKIYRKQYIQGTFSLLATVDENITEYTDSSSKDAETNYYYQICAYNYAGDSSFSDSTYSTTGSSSTGCFIATAAYGSMMEPHVQILRNFRDRFLSTNAIGKAFCNLYYKFSPPVANYIARHDALRFIIRLGLMPFVGLSWLALFIGPVSTALLMLLSVFMMIWSVKYVVARTARE